MNEWTLKFSERDKFDKFFMKILPKSDVINRMLEDSNPEFLEYDGEFYEVVWKDRRNYGNNDFLGLSFRIKDGVKKVIIKNWNMI